jgi:hypothetical protein
VVVTHHGSTLNFATFRYMAVRAHFVSCEFKEMLGKARLHGRRRNKVAKSHAILIPRRASAVLVWVGAAVAGPRLTNDIAL